LPAERSRPSAGMTAPRAQSPHRLPAGAGAKGRRRKRRMRSLCFLRVPGLRRHSARPDKAGQQRLPYCLPAMENRSGETRGAGTALPWPGRECSSQAGRMTSIVGLGLRAEARGPRENWPALPKIPWRGGIRHSLRSPRSCCSIPWTRAPSDSRRRSGFGGGPAR
jgi:hypothetical protein